MSSDWDQIDYQVSNQQISIHNTDIAFSARAPPFGGEDVVFTGAHIQGGGDAEVQWAFLNFDANLVAPNNAGNPIKKYPDGSFRTADGKFASQGGLPAPGTKSVQEYTQFLRDKGFNVVGEELTVKGLAGNRRYDAVVKTDKGELWGIEYKSGGATKTPQQNLNDMYINKFGADGVGQLAGEKVHGNITIYLP